MSMITATAWVPCGFAAEFPTKYQFDEAEFDRIAKLAKLQLDDAKEDLDDATNGTSAAKPSHAKTEDDDLKEYDLDDYDDEPADGGGGGARMQMSMFGNVRSLAYYRSNEEDPYITLHHEEHDDDDEREELQILATDQLLLAAKVEDEVAHLEVYVYEDGSDSLYVHHDVMLPAIPLCVEWLDIAVAKADVDRTAKGNFVAVGTMDPDIEVWDLDIVDCMYPNAILGEGADEDEPAPLSEGPGKTKRKKRKRGTKANERHHVDAVLSLAANRQHRNLLASASADQTVKLWDLHTRQCARSYRHHTDKVCSIAWHGRTSTVLLSGSYDRTVVAADMRAPDAVVPRWGVESDVEEVRWDPHHEHLFYVSTENGVIHHHDLRTAPASPGQCKPIWTLQAHHAAVSSFDLNPLVPGYLATGSADKEVKLWKVAGGGGGPSMVVSRNLDVGKVLSTVFAPDPQVSFRLAVAGSKGLVHVWDTSTNAAVRRAFGDRMGPMAAGEVRERLIGVQEIESESSEGEEEDGGGGGGGGGGAMDRS
ncbi:MAG: hypothetical protein M1826_004009 [Phylliscum demangeonii]|nr:MAG: hypothetical protein M1826_004009 [Phylliscum demangeonii]